MFGPIGEAKFIFLFLRNHMIKDFLEPPDTFYRKGVLRNFPYSQEKTWVRVTGG